MQLLYRCTGVSAAADLTPAQLVDLYRHPAPPGPGVWLRSNFVTSLDGSVAGRNGRASSINTASDHHVFALHRALADVILVGAQTVRTEGYRAVDFKPWQRDLRAAEGLAAFPLLAIVTRSLDLDPGLGSLNGPEEVGPVTIFTTTGHSRRLLDDWARAGVEIVASGRERVELPEVTQSLAARGLVRVLCEGGPRLHRDLLADALLDEMSLTLAPTAVGGDGGRSTAGGWLPSPAFRLNFALHADDETLFLNYQRSLSV